jgi:hypothetical protein
MILRGIAHVHSRWSYDGCHTLPEIARHARERALDFVLMSEHTRTLTAASMAAFAAECDASTAATGVLMVPGIECEAVPDHVHVLGYGVRALVTARTVGGLAAGIRAAGGFPVLAHPLYRDAFTHVRRSELSDLAGWEIWNGKADGPWYPSDGAVRHLAELRRTGATLVPMAGADLHRLEADPGIVMEVSCGGRDASEILAALARRAYRVEGRAFRFSGSDPVRAPRRSARRLVAGAALAVRRRAKSLHAWLARRGLRPPAPVAHAARRLLK